MSEIDLKKLAEPFPADDIEWRVARAGKGRNGIFCLVVAYITARAIQERLDAVCGPGNWQLTPPQIEDFGKTTSFAVGISIRINGEWVTKWDVSEPTNIEPAKGGFSGAMKRAGAQWGIGRYLYYLDETFAEVADTALKGSKQWNHAKLKDGQEYFWKAPALPSWALPKEEQGISKADLEALKKAWRSKMAPGVRNAAELADGFSRFVTSVVGEFPSSDFTLWTLDALERCQKELAKPVVNGISSDVPFEK